MEKSIRVYLEKWIISNSGIDIQVKTGIALKTENHFYIQMKHFKMTKIIQRTMKIEQIIMKRTGLK